MAFNIRLQLWQWAIIGILLISIFVFAVVQIKRHNDKERKKEKLNKDIKNIGGK
ncbi:MAG: hypothetical protein ACRDE8_06070 [Ginsengibacter sp.]